MKHNTPSSGTTSWLLAPVQLTNASMKEETIVSQGRGRIMRNHATPAEVRTVETAKTNHNNPGSRAEKGRRSKVRREDTKALQRETTTKAKDRPLAKVNGVQAKDPTLEIDKPLHVGNSATTMTSFLLGNFCDPRCKICVPFQRICVNTVAFGGYVAQQTSDASSKSCLYRSIRITSAGCVSPL